jgi:hypothetical protein
MREVWFGQARALLAALGGFVAAFGWADAGTVEVVGGALLTAGAALWSAYDKLRAR